MAIAAGLAGLIGVLHMGKVYGWRIDDLFQAFFIGAFIGPLCLSFEIFIYEPYLRRKPSFVGFVGRWLWYQGSILLSFSLFLKVFNSITLMEAYNLIAYEDKLFAGWMVAAFNFLILVNRLPGRRRLNIGARLCSFRNFGRFQNLRGSSPGFRYRLRIEVIGSVLTMDKATCQHSSAPVNSGTEVRTFYGSTTKTIVSRLIVLHHLLVSASFWWLVAVRELNPWR